MLTVAESAAQLGVSPSRVRELISQGALPAQKIGRAWVLRETDVLARLEKHPRGGRPPKHADASCAHETVPTADAQRATNHDLFLACKKNLSVRPNMAELSAIKDPEEQAFLMTVADFFLQRKQRELVQRGVF